MTYCHPHPRSRHRLRRFLHEVVSADHCWRSSAWRGELTGPAIIVRSLLSSRQEGGGLAPQATDPSWPQTLRQHQAMTSNWRYTPAWRSHRGGTNAWHREETQSALSPGRNSDESSVWQTDDSWDPWDSHSGGKNGWHGEGASHSETDGSPTAVASQAPSGDSWPRMKADDSPCSQMHPIGLVWFLNQRRRKAKSSMGERSSGHAWFQSLRCSASDGCIRT